MNNPTTSEEIIRKYREEARHESAVMAISGLVIGAVLAILIFAVI